MTNTKVWSTVLVAAIALGGCHSSSDRHSESGGPNARADVPQPIVWQRTQQRKAARVSGLLGRHHPAPPLVTVERERYRDFAANAVEQVTDNPVSTFAIDVDTASYSNVRRLLNQGRLPRHDAVRVEELINYFDYAYPAPSTTDTPFSVYSEVGPSPWSAQKHLLHIGIKGFDANEPLPPANLVFLIDVSGSMNSPNKLPLLTSSLKLLVKQMRAEDTLGIVVYAGAAGSVLPPTSGREKDKILTALAQLRAGGSTNGGAGIRLAYQMARQNLASVVGRGAINRVILATDGDFNVGTVNQRALKQLVAEERESGVGLTVLGFGAGNYNDSLMQELAQIGDGNAAYIDSLSEARKVLVDQVGGTLQTIAKDVKIQVEFNPAVVDEYRLVGYETRHLEREDFNNDKVDAGEIGRGHTVTAIYELSLHASGSSLIDPLRYAPTNENGGASGMQAPAHHGEVAFVRLRYKRPDGSIGANRRLASELVEFPVLTDSVLPTLARTSKTFRFSAAVAAFGQILRGGTYTGDYDLADVMSLAQHAKGPDRSGYRGGFLELVRTADALAPRVAAQ